MPLGGNTSPGHPACPCALLPSPSFLPAFLPQIYLWNNQMTRMNHNPCTPTAFEKTLLVSLLNRDSRIFLRKLVCLLSPNLYTQSCLPHAPPHPSFSERRGAPAPRPTPLHLSVREEGSPSSTSHPTPLLSERGGDSTS